MTNKYWAPKWKISSRITRLDVSEYIDGISPFICSETFNEAERDQYLDTHEQAVLEFGASFSAWLDDLAQALIGVTTPPALNALEQYREMPLCRDFELNRETGALV